MAAKKPVTQSSQKAVKAPAKAKATPPNANAPAQKVVKAAAQKVVKAAAPKVVKAAAPKVVKAAAPKVVKAAAPKMVKAAAPKAKALAPKAETAAVASVGLSVGDKAPAFSLSDQNGKTVSSASLAGKPYVIYFYPKDDTPGCTREACGFQEEGRAFAKAGVTVLGVSPDSTGSHAKFAGKYSLAFPLLSDPEKRVVNDFGVWVKKQNYGREYMGVERATFLVDAGGKVQKIWRRVKVDGHVSKVLEAARGD